MKKPAPDVLIAIVLAVIFFGLVTLVAVTEANKDNADFDNISG